jgi:hypothetical protein
MDKFLITALLMLSFTAHGADSRLYQWTNPVSGTTQMSGKPPAWYRSQDETGPRVFVFESGKLIDDTSIAVAEEQRAELRSTAFGVAEVEVAPEPLFEGEGDFASQLRLSLPGFEEESAAGQSSETTQAMTEGGGPPQAPSDDKIQQSIDRLKAIIYDWDNRQTARAREILEENLNKEEAGSE